MLHDRRFDKDNASMKPHSNKKFIDVLNVFQNRDHLLRVSTFIFIMSAAVILAITGVAKIWSSFGSVEVLAQPDPLTGMAFGRLMFVVGIAECAIAALCLLVKSNRVRLFIIAWLATNFLVYRIGLLAMGWHTPCKCLGGFTDAIHMSPHVADKVMRIVLGYLLIGSYAFSLILYGVYKSSKNN